MLSTRVLMLSRVNQRYRAVWCREPTVKSAMYASRLVAVETIVTHHPAQIRTGGIAAYGSYRRVGLHMFGREGVHQAG